MNPGLARRCVARAMLAVVALSVMSPGWLLSAEAGNRFKIRGSASGLMPGVRGNLVIAIRNPYDFTIVVHGVKVVPHDAARHCKAANIVSPGITRNVRVKPHSVRKVTVRITLRSKAPRGCQGATFPLSFDGIATRP